MAVDQSSGDLYIADQNNRRIDRFDSAGDFQLAWGWGVADGAAELETCMTPTGCRQGVYNGAAPAGVMNGPASIAVDQSNHRVYVSAGDYRVQKFSANGEWLLMFGREVDKTSHADVCTKADLEAGDTCGAGVQGTGPAQINGREPPIALDPSGDVWVGDDGRLEKFEADGIFIEELPLPASGFSSVRDLAVDSVGNLYVVGALSNPGVHRFEVTGPGELTEAETIDAVSARYKAIALDGSDDLYVADRPEGGQAVFREFNPSGEQIDQFGLGQIFGSLGPSGMAVGDTAQALYSNSSSISGSVTQYAAQLFPLPKPGAVPGNERTQDVLPTEATLKATLNPENQPTTYHFEYDTAPYSEGEAPHGTKAPIPDASLAASWNDEAVEVTLEHLIPSTAYHWRLVAESECEPVANPGHRCLVETADQSFETLPPVAFDSEWATGVAATSADFHAELNALGAAAEWWVEYGISEGYGTDTTAGRVASGFGDVPVASRVTGLEPGTTYHYRFAARDERDGAPYTLYSEDHTITTQLNSIGFELADARAWEMVSPADKHGGKITVQFDGMGVMQAAAGGDAVSYISLGSIDAAPEGNRAIEFSQVLGRRGMDGWRSTDVTLPHTEVTEAAVGTGLEYRLFSPDLSSALVEPRDGTLLSDEASERTPYLRNNFADPASYRPLVSGKEPYANVPPGTEFGGVPISPLGDVAVRGASPDLSHVVLQSRVPLVAGAPRDGLYEWAYGLLRLVSLLPASEGGTPVEGELGAGSHGVRHAVSDDGSRVFWNPGGEGTPGAALYVRDTATEETARLDVVQPGATGSGAKQPVFQGASADGSRVFFTDTQRLTEDASTSGADLYLCELVENGAGELECDLTDLSANGAEGASVQGILPGFGDDGANTYMVADGVLAATSNAEGESAAPGNCGPAAPASATCNLYLLREDPQGGGWETRFIASLSYQDRNDWGTSGSAESQFLSAAASASGRYLVFMSERSPTGYDNRDAMSGAADEEVYRYDAVADELVCVSCNASGARPAGLRLPEGELIPPDVDQGNRWSGRWLAAAVPDPIDMTLAYSVYQPRFVFDSGRVLFNAADSLVPADSNGTFDVYEYEPTGTASCTASSGGAAITRIAGGCVALLSSGTANEESALLDASASGGDVFFFSPARLSVLDEDSVYDIYDARVNGTPETSELASECLGEACQPAAEAPIDATPASSGFEGPGNPKPRRYRAHKRRHHRKHHRHRSAGRRVKHARAIGHHRRAVK